MTPRCSICRRRLRQTSSSAVRAGLCGRCFQGPLSPNRKVIVEREPRIVGRRVTRVARPPLEKVIDGVLYEVVFDGTKPEVVLR